MIAIALAFLAGASLPGCKDASQLPVDDGGDSSSNKGKSTDGGSSDDDRASEPQQVSGTFLTGVGPAKDYAPTPGHEAFGTGIFDPKTNMKLRLKLSGLYVSLVTLDGIVVHPRLIAAPQNSPWHAYFELPSGGAAGYKAAKARAATFTPGGQSLDVPVSPTDSFSYAPTPPPDGAVFFPATIDTQPPQDSSAQVQMPDPPDAAFDPDAGFSSTGADPSASTATAASPAGPPAPPPKSVLFVTSRKATPGAPFDPTKASGTSTLDFAAVTDADQLCATLAANAGRTETNWYALLAGDHDGIRVRLATIAGDVVDTTGNLLAHGDDLWTQPLGLPAYDETGASIVGPSDTIANPKEVWTGAGPDGSATGNSCKGWSSRDPGDQGTVGDATSKTQWLGGVAQEPCNAAHRLLCLSIPLGQ